MVRLFTHRYIVYPASLTLVAGGRRNFYDNTLYIGAANAAVNIAALQFGLRDNEDRPKVILIRGHQREQVVVKADNDRGIQ